MDYASESLIRHYEWQGKIEIKSRVPVRTREELSLAYTPGVAQPCLEIKKDKSKSFELTCRANLVAIITDGSAVLGLGDIGAEAAMPVMEGKAVLFKELGGIDAIPICINSRDIDEIVNTVRLISGSFGGINLEDISAPRCFEIEKRLIECCDIPVFHDDQHGTAVVVLAAVMNALRITGRNQREMTTVINGAGAAGIAIAQLLCNYGIKNLILCDRHGSIYDGRDHMNAEKQWIAKMTNPESRKGDLADILVGADLFIGVSSANCVTQAMVESMNKDSIIFAMANPDPEIMPALAKAGGARIVGTGRSDYPNQINNVLAFPGIFKGALSVRASCITDEMKQAAAYAIASYIKDNDLNEENIIPSPLDRSVTEAVANAVADAARM